MDLICRGIEKEFTRCACLLQHPNVVRGEIGWGRSVKQRFEELHGKSLVL
jgi:hypothetical protein